MTPSLWVPEVLASGRQWVFAKRGSTQRKFYLYTLWVTVSSTFVLNTFKAPNMQKHTMFLTVVMFWPIDLGHGACCQLT